MTPNPITRGQLARLYQLRARLPVDSTLRVKVRHVLNAQGAANREGSPAAFVDRLLTHLDQLGLLVVALAELADN
jgi:hypothetical protein